MSRRNYFFGALLLTGFLFTSSAFADEASPETPATVPAPATNRPAFNASLRHGETVGNEQIQRAFLTIGASQVAFIVPTGFFMDASDPQKIVLSDNTGLSFITVRVRPKSEVSADTDFFKTQALGRFPGAKISSQSTEIAVNHSGPAFTLDWAGPDGGAQSARVIFIPCAAGVLEFSLLTRSANFKDAQLYLTVLLSSLRTNESGKLVIVPLPSAS
jgi:hypothetical protein